MDKIIKQHKILIDTKKLAKLLLICEAIERANITMLKDEPLVEKDKFRLLYYGGISLRDIWEKLKGDIKL